MKGFIWQIKKHKFFIVFILIYLGLSACSDQKQVNSEEKQPKNIEWVNKNDFHTAKNQITILENQTSQVVQDIDRLKTQLDKTDKEIAIINKQLNNLVVNQSKVENLLISRLELSERNIKDLEKKVHVKQVAKNSKRKKTVLRFKYVIADISRWGSQLLVSLKVNGEFVFITQGDVIGDWRLDSANIETRQVIFKHRITDKTISRAVL